MVKNRNYGVGTGQSSSGVLNPKTTFAHDEKIYAVHVWDKLAGNEVFEIIWNRKINGTYKLQKKHTWTNTGFSSAYQQAWIQNYTPGEWQALFKVTGGSYKSTLFTIKSAPAPPPEPAPEFPKTISRGTYSFTAGNSEEEKQLREFLGLFPPGDDLDTWLSKRDLAGLQQWKDYWFGIFGPMGRQDLLTFIANKFEEYKSKIEVPFLQQLLDLIPKPIINILTFLKGLSQVNLNTVLVELLKLPDGEAKMEEIGLKSWNEFVKEYPEYKVLEGAPRGSLSILAILGIVGAIISFGTLANWLRKELPEPAGMAVWAMIEAKNWEGAKEANLKYRDFVSLANSFWMQALGWLNPFIKTFFDTNKDAQLVAADSYDKIIDTELEIKTGTIIIKPTPTDAKVSISGQIPTIGVFEKEVPLGTYDWTVTKFGYISKSGIAILEVPGEFFELFGEEVTIYPEEEPPEVPELPPEEVLGKLTINVSPADAIIAIAGQPEIITAGSYDLSPGSYGVFASKEGFVSQLKSAFVSEKKDTVVSFILEEVEAPAELPTKATVQIISEPTGSDIYIDGAYQFVTTPFTTILDAGTYIIRVQQDGFFPQEASVSVSEGDEIIVPFSLEEIPEEEKPVVEYLPQEPWFPTYQAPTYYQPAVQTTPYSQVSLPNYNLLAAPSFKLQPRPAVPTTMEKEVLINIETTDAKPWKGKIFSIAWLDLSMPESEPQVIVDNDEQGILKAFIEIFEQTGFTKIWGFKTIFDYRYIFNKLMLYRMQSKAFFDADLGDVKQLMDQVKEAFVYFPDKTGKLDDYGKELLGIGKYGAQDALLRRYIAGDFEYVERFNLQQIQVTKGLYDLFRFSSSGASTTPIQSNPIETSPGSNPGLPQNPISTQIKKCPSCLSNQPIGAEFCDICKTKL